jgi:hypothetical protein
MKVEKDPLNETQKNINQKVNGQEIQLQIKIMDYMHYCGRKEEQILENK